MLLLVSSLLLLTLSVFAVEHVEPTCRDLTCASRESLISQIRSLKKDVASKSEMLADSDCNACYSAPCQNGGTCLPDGKYGFRCACPDDTAGNNCEKQIKCDSKTCGKNADCFVQNHQTNCVCHLGFSGDPKRGCSMASRKICFNGDPHYTTFDGGYYDYQATCPYMFSFPCNGSLTGGYSFFSVKAKNDIATPRETVSWVTSTQVEFYNQTIFVDRYLHVYVNGVQVHVPYYYPSKAYTQFSITLRNNDVVIKNDNYVEVDFHYGQLCLVIPDVPAFRGATTLCGLAGNFDGNCKDDYVTSNGTVLGQKCRPDQKTVDQFADTWRTDVYTQPSPPPACVDGWTMTNNTKGCIIENAAVLCNPIDQARTGEGPFGGCQQLGVDAIQRAVDSCTYDVCRDETLLCSSMADFVHSCQFAFGNVDLSSWRAQTKCEMECPAHSTYSACVSACPATCAEHEVPIDCGDPCAEGCACDYGYVLDTTQLQTITCIAVQNCGCTDNNGNMHPANEHWLSDNCEQSNYCSNGTYYRDPYSCQSHAHCGVANGAVACVCDSGFVYNSTSEQCDDIDECLDPESCSTGKGHGVCFNTPGSYYCECAQYYSGHDCETYAPMRHCADLYKYYNVRDDGVYNVSVPVDANYGDIKVYCDMSRDGGGWMLMANALTNETADKTLEEYAAGFGDVDEKDAWMGLDLISLYTNYQTTSLHLNLYRCAHNGLQAKWTDCTYPQFSVSDKSDGYRVTIPKTCSGGSEIGNYEDGWARWDLSQTGPAFVAFDNDNSTSRCSETFRNTGWWFDTTYRCGPANLNGVRFVCEDYPVGAEAQTYLYWNGDPINKAELFIRPAGFPNYD